MGTSGEIFTSVLDNDHAILGFTNRFGGVSENFGGGNFQSLNLAFHVNDNSQKVAKNREILAHTLKIPVHNLIFLNQIHSDKIAVLTAENFKGENSENFAVADAIITNLKNVAICVLVADCSPVLVFDSKNNAIAAIHAGRAGIMQKILTKTILKMDEIYGSKPQNLSVFVGANIKGKCYEIGNLDLKEFENFRCDNFGVLNKNGKNFDQNSALKAELNELKISNFSFSQICTHCDQNYFSYRRDGVCGRFCGFAMLK